MEGKRGSVVGRFLHLSSTNPQLKHLHFFRLLLCLLPQSNLFHSLSSLFLPLFSHTHRHTQLSSSNGCSQDSNFAVESFSLFSQLSLSFHPLPDLNLSHTSNSNCIWDTQSSLTLCSNYQSFWYNSSHSISLSIPSPYLFPLFYTIGSWV